MRKWDKWIIFKCKVCHLPNMGQYLHLESHKHKKHGQQIHNKEVQQCFRIFQMLEIKKMSDKKHSIHLWTVILHQNQETGIKDKWIQMDWMIPNSKENKLVELFRQLLISKILIPQCKRKCIPEWIQIFRAWVTHRLKPMQDNR